MSANRRIKRARQARAETLALEGWVRLPEVMFCDAHADLGDGVAATCGARIEGGFPTPKGGFLTVCPDCGRKAKVREIVFGERVLDGIGDTARAVQAVFAAALARVFGK